jgi:hypothetical protein
VGTDVESVGGNDGRGGGATPASILDRGLGCSMMGGGAGRGGAGRSSLDGNSGSGRNGVMSALAAEAGETTSASRSSGSEVGICVKALDVVRCGATGTHRLQSYVSYNVQRESGK